MTKPKKKKVKRTIKSFEELREVAKKKLAKEASNGG